jgi:hypothetical protein
MRKEIGPIFEREILANWSLAEALLVDEDFVISRASPPRQSLAVYISMVAEPQGGGKVCSHF